MKSQNAAIEESQLLELEIQAAIEKANEAVKTCSKLHRDRECFARDVGFQFNYANRFRGTA